MRSATHSYAAPDQTPNPPSSSKPRDDDADFSNRSEVENPSETKGVGANAVLKKQESITAPPMAPQGWARFADGAPRIDTMPFRQSSPIPVRPPPPLHPFAIPAAPSRPKVTASAMRASWVTQPHSFGLPRNLDDSAPTKTFTSQASDSMQMDSGCKIERLLSSAPRSEARVQDHANEAAAHSTAPLEYQSSLESGEIVETPPCIEQGQERGNIRGNSNSTKPDQLPESLGSSKPRSGAAPNPSALLHVTVVPHDKRDARREHDLDDMLKDRDLARRKRGSDSLDVQRHRKRSRSPSPRRSGKSSKRRYDSGSADDLSDYDRDRRHRHGEPRYDRKYERVHHCRCCHRSEPDGDGYSLERASGRDRTHRRVDDYYDSKTHRKYPEHGEHRQRREGTEEHRRDEKHDRKGHRGSSEDKARLDVREHRKSDDLGNSRETRPRTAPQAEISRRYTDKLQVCSVDTLLHDARQVVLPPHWLSKSLSINYISGTRKQQKKMISVRRLDMFVSAYTQIIRQWNDKQKTMVPRLLLGISIWWDCSNEEYNGIGAWIGHFGGSVS